MKVKSLHIYPVKACRGIDLTEAIVEPRGFAHDRRWMLVDEAGRYITQREQPKLATIATAIKNGGLELSHAGGTLTLREPDSTAPRLTVTLWKQQVDGYAAGDDADKWFSDYLGLLCRLVFQGGLPRAVSPQYAAEGTMASYADGFPFLVTTTASLDDLNKRLPSPLPMNRFRPNIVIEGAAAWAEDTWRKIKINGIVFDLPKPCTRCIVTTTDQQTGGRDGNEPLKTLKDFRLLRTPALTGVVFGQNAIPMGQGLIKTGDSVEIVESQTAPEFVKAA